MEEHPLGNRICYAHSLADHPQCDWEPLETHLTKVASLAGQFAAAFGCEEWGRLAGLWHDLGKYSAEFQRRLESANGIDSHLETFSDRVDHSTAGAQYAACCHKGLIGQILAYCIAGHHGGLPDNIAIEGGRSGLAERLRKSIPEFRRAAPLSLLQSPRLSPPQFDWYATEDHKAFQVSVLCRMLFSCLVDADFLATECFIAPDRAADRHPCTLVAEDLQRSLDEHLSRFAADTPVNKARAKVLTECREKAELDGGFFSLTVPTGGGKTLSSLAFALRHAVKHELRRIIYAIPFTSIIEQNVDVFRQALAKAGTGVLLEHHSNLDSDKETRIGRLASENWDAPLVVTTNVQLFESPFANKPSRCRKLHRIAKSVIILDECQTLPVSLLTPTLRMLNELCRNYGCSVVLCSATQPAVVERPDFPIGLQDVREIVTDPSALYSSLCRVSVQRIEKLNNATLATRLREHEQVLCVVSTRGHAVELFRLLEEGDDGGTLHLSANMCASHRSAVLRVIRRKLERGDRCRVISTQLVEAGVDIDFPVVYRAMTGVDSIAQAAGRCNREGKLALGQVYVFDTDVDPPGDLRTRRQKGEEVSELHDDLLGLPAVEHYFKLLYWSKQDEWDQHEIMRCFQLSKEGLHAQFREAASRYRLIRDEQLPVLVPYGRKGRRLIAELRAAVEPPNRQFNRRAQRYVVGVYERQLRDLGERGAVSQIHDQFWILEDDPAYDRNVGLRMDYAAFQPERFCF